MALPKPPVDDDALSKAFQLARVKDNEQMATYGYRIAEIDTLEDEIIDNYANNPSLKLSQTPSLTECQLVYNAGQKILNRITEIEAKSLKIKTKIAALRGIMLDNIIVALGTSGSADTRKANASKAVEQMNYLVALEEGLSTICDTVRKNIIRATDGASRNQSAISDEIKYLGGAEVAKAMIEETREVLKNG